MSTELNAKEYVAGLIKRARKAQAAIEFATQEQVDDLCARIAWAGANPEYARKLADFAAEDSQLGDAPSKIGKIRTKIKGAYRDTKGQKSVGIIERDTEKGLVKIAKPIGVIGAIIPCTNCEATPFVKTIHAIKTRNAIVTAPHPRTQTTNKMVTDTMRAVLKQNGWPEDLVVNVDKVTLEVSAEVMKQCDLILATGGAGMVKAAYSSGKPCYGVGAGNAPMIVDETADLKDAANKIMRSKTFDQATSCSTENSVTIQEEVYDDMVKALQAEGGYLVPAEQKPMLQKAMWDEKGILSRKIVAQPAAKIAAEAGFDLPAGKTFLMVEETGIGHDYPFSREKLSVVTTLYRYKEFEDAINHVNNITAFEGPGHSCGIHTTRDDRIMELAHRARVCRVMIRQGQCLANSGNWFNGMPMTMTLGCGSWGGNSASKNISWTELMNVTWVSYPIEGSEPPDEELFGPEIMSA